MINTSSPVEMGKEEFKRIGHLLVDSISEFIDSINERQVTTGETPVQIQEIVGTSSLPEEGKSPEEILAGASRLLFEHSLLNGHPRFFGYVSGSPAPLGALADLLAAAVNPNVGANILSPAATEIEKQTVSWLAELVGVPSYGGLLVSGGNMANFTGFLAGRSARSPENLKTDGLTGIPQKMTIYCSDETHTWIEKAASLSGMGTGAIRWIRTDNRNMMDLNILKLTLQSDIKNGLLPLMVIGNAGSVATGAIDDLAGIADICKKYNLWFHVDGAYGLPSAVLPELKPQFSGVSEADSIAIDPHKWLYSPIEAGCTLVKDPGHLRQAFSFHPAYYNFNDEDASIRNYHEYGLENSRGFRAFKVWCLLQQSGRSGYEKLIGHDIKMSQLLSELAEKHPELESVTQNLSISTFRYIPAGHDHNSEVNQAYLNRLNEELLNELQKGGEVFLSNAVVNGKYCLRTCIVNFRTTEQAIRETIDIIVREGRRMHGRLKVEGPSATVSKI